MGWWLHWRALLIRAEDGMAWYGRRWYWQTMTWMILKANTGQYHGQMMLSKFVLYLSQYACQICPCAYARLLLCLEFACTSQFDDQIDLCIVYLVWVWHRHCRPTTTSYMIYIIRRGACSKVVHVTYMHSASYFATTTTLNFLKALTRNLQLYIASYSMLHRQKNHLQASLIVWAVWSSIALRICSGARLLGL